MYRKIRKTRFNTDALHYGNVEGGLYIHIITLTESGTVSSKSTKGSNNEVRETYGWGAMAVVLPFTNSKKRDERLL